MELLDGLDLPEAELEAFLRTVELDPEHVAALSLLAQQALEEEDFELAREILTTIRRVAGDRSSWYVE